MTELTDRIRRGLGIAHVLGKIGEVDAENRAALKRLMDVGDTKAATITLDDGFGPYATVPVGAARYQRGNVTARISDPLAFQRWVQDNHPAEIVQSVRPSYETAIKAAAKKAGVPVDPATGETIPGVEVTTGDPYITIVPAGTVEAEAALIEAMFADGAAGARALIAAPPPAPLEDS